MKQIFLILLAAALFAGCATAPKIRVSVLYPNEEGKHFDVEYYRDSHMVMVDELLKPYGMLASGIDHGIAGGEPGQAAPFICIGWMTYSTVEEFQEAFEAHAETLFADVPNFTDIPPIIQISEIKK
jgi:uncharacterized protein (TIGR02118 family)